MFIRKEESLNVLWTIYQLDSEIVPNLVAFLLDGVEKKVPPIQGAVKAPKSGENPAQPMQRKGLRKVISKIPGFKKWASHKVSKKF